WFALAARLDQSDYLAVSYIPVGAAGCGPGGRCVGTFPAAASRDTAVVDTLRLVYDPRPGVTAATPSFRFEIRSAYRVGARALAPIGLRARRARQRLGVERPQPAVAQQLPDPGRLGKDLPR